MNSSAMHRILATGALLFLVLPNALFLLGWIHAWLAIPLVAWLLVAAFLVRNKLTFSHAPWKRSDFVCMLGLLIGCAFMTESLAFTGHTLQGADFAVRNAIYDTLVREDWPLHNGRGDHFTYYLGYWLPAAAIAKLCPCIDRNVILWWWTYGGFALMTGLFYVRFRRKTPLLLGVMFLTAPLFEWVDAPFLLEEIAAVIPMAQPLADAFSPLGQWIEGFRYDPLWRQLAVFCFNNGIPAGVLFAFLMSIRARPLAMLFASAQIVSTSFFSALAILPLLAQWLWRQRGSLAPTLLTRYAASILAPALMLVACVGMYLAGSNGASFHFLWQHSPDYRECEMEAGYRWLRYLVNLTLLAMPMIFFLRRRYKRTAFYQCSVLLAVFLPLLWVGYDNNELLLKGSVVLLLMLATLYALRFLSCNSRAVRAAMLLFFLLGSIHFLWDFVLRYAHYYTWNPQKMEKNINTRWQGHLEHPESKSYTRFSGTPLYPFLFK